LQLAADMAPLAQPLAEQVDPAVAVVAQHPVVLAQEYNQARIQEIHMCQHSTVTPAVPLVMLQ
jgi:hypothetical protein